MGILVVVDSMIDAPLLLDVLQFLVPRRGDDRFGTSRFREYKASDRDSARA